MDETIAEVKEEESIHQMLMNKAYDLWQTEVGKRLRYENFLDLINEKLGSIYYHAVITGNLNYQVENGGFSQWYFNGYHITIDDLICFFRDKFKDNKTINNLIDNLTDILETIDWYDEGKRCIKNINYDYKDLFEEVLEEKFNNELSGFDDYYYKINDDINEILEEYFKTEYNKISTEIREENT
jgi:hypothetical protein